MAAIESIQKNDKVVGIFIDLAKVFDGVNYSLLMAKLINRCYIKFFNMD